MVKMKDKPTKQVTSYDVAKEAGVSQSAVSRAYKPGGSVSQKTRKKIAAAAKKLGYQPNAIARSLISNRSNIIGVVMADIANPFYPQVLEVLLRKLHESGLKAILLMALRDQNVDDLLPQLLGYQVDGLIITSATLSTKMADKCTKMGVPVVLFNRYIQNSRASSICCDNRSASYQAAELFIEQGYSSIGYIAGIENASTNLDREASFYERLRQAGLEPQKAAGGFTYKGGYEAALALAKGGEHPRAIFCANDIMAMGAMDAIRYRLNLSIPGDIAIIGFDDIQNASWPNYNITTFRVPIERMVQRAIDNLLENREGNGVHQVSEYMAAELILRETTLPKLV